MDRRQVTVYRERSARDRRHQAIELAPGARDHRRWIAGRRQSIFEDSRGRVWVSTTRGVGYLENDRFVAVGGVPGGMTRAIVEDSRRQPVDRQPGPRSVSSCPDGSDRSSRSPWTVLRHAGPSPARWRPIRRRQACGSDFIEAASSTSLTVEYVHRTAPPTVSAQGRVSCASCRSATGRCGSRPTAG